MVEERRMSWFEKSVFGVLGFSVLAVGSYVNFWLRDCPAPSGGIYVYPDNPSFLDKKLLDFMAEQNKKGKELIVLEVINEEVYRTFDEWSQKLEEDPSYEEFFKEDPNKLFEMEPMDFGNDYKTWNNYPVYIINSRRRDIGTDLSFRVIDSRPYPVERLIRDINPGMTLAITAGNTYGGGVPYGFVDPEQTDFSNSDVIRGARISDRIHLLTEKNEFLLDIYNR